METSPGSVQNMDIRDYAAADKGRSREALLRPLYEGIAGYPEPFTGRGGKAPEALGGTWLL